MTLRLGYLSDYFEGIVVKRLAGVEADPNKSHQHELHGVRPILQLFGKPEGQEKLTIECQYAHFPNGKHKAEYSFMTLYDARAKGRENGLNDRSEYRLYFRDNEVTNSMQEGDYIFIGKRHDQPALVVILSKDCEELPLLLWLIGVSPSDKSLKFREASYTHMSSQEIPASIRELFRIIGVHVQSFDECVMDMISTFGDAFPKTSVFSAYARSKSQYANATEASADQILVNWLNTEESLFMAFEQHLLKEKLSRELTPESFIEEAKSFMNRRYTRAGQSLENQFEQILKDRGILYSRTPKTEGKSRPDFIFPSIEKYHDMSFPPALLHMLGVKTSCKDRWRQILAEANRIEMKHLLTLQPGISESQTDEMIRHHVQLVLPRCLHDSYTQAQQTWLMDVEDFLAAMKKAQQHGC